MAARRRSCSARRSARCRASRCRSPSATDSLAQPLLFIAGGTISGIYTLGVVLIGQDFRGQRLAVVSTGFAMAYSAGSIVGSTPVGYLVDLFGAEALPIAIGLGFVGLTVFLFLRRETDAAAERAELPAELKELPEIHFDLAFLHDPEPIAAFAPEPEEGEGLVVNSRAWQENNLEEWFRQRAMELARRAHRRHLGAMGRIGDLEIQ